MYQNQQPLLQEEDLLSTVLADHKRVAREYTTAVTESNCMVVRQAFTELLQDTLSMQGKLYNLMKQQNRYGTSSPALRQEIDKQLQQNGQTGQKTQQFVNQALGGQNAGQQLQQQQQMQSAQQQMGITDPAYAHQGAPY
jgi:spore coat protein F